MGQVVECGFSMRLRAEGKGPVKYARLRPLLYLKGTDDAGAYEWSVWVEGESGVLATSAMRGECPVGILLDRLEDGPDVVGGDGLRFREAVQWLRERYPTGAELLPVTVI